MSPSEHIPLFSGSRIYDEDKAYWMTLDWACECYVFTTNQTPDSHNFLNGGGAFYILFKHRGQINSTLYPYYQNFKLQIETTSSDTTPITHMPSYSTKNSSNEWTSKYFIFNTTARTNRGTWQPPSTTNSRCKCSGTMGNKCSPMLQATMIPTS